MLLSAIETERRDEGVEEDLGYTDRWDWEERYIALLWLSQLLFAPFDLASISSQGPASDIPVGSTLPVQSSIPGLTWPLKIPSIAVRTIPLAIHYLSTSGKERDAAKVLLVRLAMRKDMQELGVMQALLKWAISCLRPSSHVESSTYYYIGVLSFIAGILKSSMGTADVDAYLPIVFDVIQRICSSEDDFSRSINASPVIRQTSVNVLRNISVLLLRSNGINGSSEMVEWTIGYLLDSLGDPATPVRIATSKALSVVTLKLASEMAEQVIEEILNALRKDVIRVSTESQTRDLSTVNPLEWHGLILTLSQLLYRRAPPPSQLAQIIAALIDGVNFEQRSTSGSSVGTNVRDAANLGIWAIARRYTTDELQAIDTTSIAFARGGDGDVLQKLATVLVVSASLDPAGNIRRGSSAALQELIGRHPNTIIVGIALVQTVEYSSVALRSKAMQEVAVKAAILDQIYCKSLLTGLDSWRGVGDPDASVRRNAAITFGIVACKHMAQDIATVGDEIFWASYCSRIDIVQHRLRELKQRQVDERHGLILCLAETVSSVEAMFSNERASHKFGFPTTYPKNVQTSLRTVLRSILEDANTATYRRPELIVEAICRLLIPVCPLLNSKYSTGGINDPDLYTLDFTGNSDSRNKSSESGHLFDLADDLLGKWLRRTEPEVVDVASKATFAIFSLRSSPQRQDLVSNWINIICEDQGSRSGQAIGVLVTLFRAYNTNGSFKAPIMQATRARWDVSRDIESRVAILQCFCWSHPFLTDSEQFTEIVAEGLDDYTTDARGDIGSLVRVEALKATSTVWRLFDHLGDKGPRIFNTLFPKVLRLAAEKLDKVRSEAQNSVAAALRSESQLTPFDYSSPSKYAARFKGYSPSSKDYFRFLLDMPTHSDFFGAEKYKIEWHEDLLEGFINSADTGSEDLVRASRAALAEYCESNDDNPNIVCGGLFAIMKRSLKNDRIVVPAMEVMGFLFDYQIMQHSATKYVHPLSPLPLFQPEPQLTYSSWRSLYALIQNAHYQSGNIRKLEAAVKLYGGLLDVYPDASQKLTSMLLHKYPKVRNEAADTLFAKGDVGKGVNWVKAKQADLVKLRDTLALNA